MVLNELDAGTEVRLVEFIRYVPPKRSELPPLLNGGVEEGDSVQQGLPLWEIRDVQLVLGHTGVGSS